VCSIGATEDVAVEGTPCEIAVSSGRISLGESSDDLEDMVRSNVSS